MSARAVRSSADLVGSSRGTIVWGGGGAVRQARTGRSGLTVATTIAVIIVIQGGRTRERDATNFRTDRSPENQKVTYRPYQIDLY